MQMSCSPPPSLVSLSLSLAPYTLSPSSEFLFPKAPPKPSFLSPLVLSPEVNTYVHADAHPIPFNTGLPSILRSCVPAPLLLKRKVTPPPHPGMVLDWIKLMGRRDPLFPQAIDQHVHLATGSE